MKWLNRLLGEPPEPRGLYCMPGIPPPVPSRGMYLDPGQIPVTLMQPAMDAGQPAPRERKERGGYAAGDMTVSEMPPPPPSVTVQAGDGPQFTATQRLWFTPRQLREAARKGGITVKAEATGDMLWLAWEYGMPEGTGPDCYEAE